MDIVVELICKFLQKRKDEATMAKEKTSKGPTMSGNHVQADGLTRNQRRRQLAASRKEEYKCVRCGGEHAVVDCPKPLSKTEKAAALKGKGKGKDHSGKGGHSAFCQGSVNAASGSGTKLNMEEWYMMDTGANDSFFGSFMLMVPKSLCMLARQATIFLCPCSRHTVLLCGYNCKQSSISKISFCMCRQGQ